jgi:tetratricopeptide (TPR) repeat protein
MTTHIFVAMGMWDDVVSQNEIASGHDHENWRAGHYTLWLGYGYLQQGRYAEARKHLEKLRANVAPPFRRGEQPSLIVARAHYVINSERWLDPVLGWKLEAPSTFPVISAIDAFTHAYSALKAGRRAEAEQLQTELARRNATERSRDAASGDESPVILEMELRAIMAVQAGDNEGAVRILREAAAREDAIPFEFGPPDIIKPTHELLGEVLLSAGRAAEAVREFSRALELAPGRSRALLGLARAAAATGDRSVAQRALGDLKRNWHAADKDIPEVAEVERLIANGN